MRCGNCDKTDGLRYTSNPPKVKCTITGEYHLYDDKCNCEEKGSGTMKVRKYEYLIAYHHKRGMGTSYFTRTEKIESISDALKVSKEIEIPGKIENVGIINIQLLREFVE